MKDSKINADYLSSTQYLTLESKATHVFIEEAKVNFHYVPVKDQQLLTFGSAKVKDIHIPGHTKESTSYLIDENF